MGGFTSILGLKQSNQKSSDRYWANFVQNVYDDGVPLQTRRKYMEFSEKYFYRKIGYFTQVLGQKQGRGTS